MLLTMIHLFISDGKQQYTLGIIERFCILNSVEDSVNKSLKETEHPNIFKQYVQLSEMGCYYGLIINFQI